MKPKIKPLWTGIFILLNLIVTYPGQGEPLKVGISENAPFVFIDEKGKESGFSIDLIQEIATDQGLDIEFHQTDLADKINRVRNGDLDLAIGGISITYDRVKSGILFSYPVMNMGLTILVKKAPSRLSVVPMIFQNLFSWEVANMVMFLLIVLLFWGLWLWLAERGSDVIRDNFKDGFLDAIWCAWAVKTTIGFGDVYPKKIPGRLLTIPIFFTGAIVIAIVSAPINAAFVQRNIEETRSTIQSDRDLQGKRIATKKGSQAVFALEKRGAIIVEMDTIEDAIGELDQGRVDAVVFDAPGLKYYSKKNPEFTTVGPLFSRHNAGIAFPPQADQLRKRINESLLKMQEDGRYRNIYEKYFL